MPADELLKTYVILYNHGVESGDFDPLMELFENDSVIEFEDDKIGKFEGKEMIGGMLRRQGPSNMIELFEIKAESDSAVAGFSYEDNPEITAGSLRLFEKGNKIIRLVVTL